jgi:aldehyde dehydrogenase (NAD+)
VLVIGAWNYPIQLCLVPMAGAIAGGNAVVVKPSEISQHSAALLASLIPKYLDDRCIRVVNGSVQETTAVLQQRYDHIFFTGSTAVGSLRARGSTRRRDLRRVFA